MIWMWAKFYNKREFKKILCYIVNFMQALMSIQYYAEPENIYRPKLSRMNMNYILRSTKIGAPSAARILVLLEF